MFAILLSEGMNPFYQTISSFPTVIFSILLVIVVFYWLVAVLGFVDLDVLDFDIPDIETELSSSHSADTTTPDVLAGLLIKFGLNGVPVTIVVSFVTVIAWFFSYFSMYFLPTFLSEGILHYVIGLPVFFIALTIAVFITAILIKPLRPFFKAATLQSKKHIVGQVAVVRSSVVNDKSGEAVLNSAGADLVLKVRSGPDEHFKRGDRVVLLEHITELNTFRVISETEFTG